MTTQLPERLRALADEAPAALTARDLWQTGTRRHRRRLVTSVSIAGCMVVAATLIGVGDWQSRRTEPAPRPSTATGQTAVPDRFLHPSPWLPGTTTPGPLVALLGTTRDHFPFGSDLNALVGVSAGSQAYHFIDLPGWAADQDTALSPDGRHLAYWISGQPTKKATIGDRSIVGVATLDLITGQVERHVVSTAHGWAPLMLTWTDDRTLAMAAGHYTDARVTSFSGRTSVRLFTVGSPSPVVLPRSNVLQVPVATTGGGYAGMVGLRTLRTYDASGSRITSVRTSAPLKSVAYDEASGRVAGTRGNINASGSTSGRLIVGRVRHGHAQLSEVPGDRSYYSVLGWADADHVVAERLVATGESFVVVDVHTGAQRRLTDTGYQATGSRWFSVVLASGALRHPASAAAIEPPRPWNPRWVAGGVLAGLVLFGSSALLLVRRSRRVRR